MRLYLLLLLLLSMLRMAYAEPSFPVGALAQKIDNISQAFMGLPYLIDPLGEEQGQDTDPLYRFDGFDCTTYVETVWALAAAKSSEHFSKFLIEIRYKGSQPLFTERNHFTDADWIPNNVQKGLLKDVTLLISNQALVAQAKINKTDWFKLNHRVEFASAPVIAEIPYLSLAQIFENALEVLKRIPHGAIINIVRPNWALKEKIGTNLNVSHQGFAIRKNDGVLYFRHASQSLKVVTEEPLMQYLARMRDIPSIGGINIVMPQELVN